MTDAALVRRAQQGDELAMQRILKRYEGLIRTIAANYFLLGADDDDVRQEARFGAFKAVRDFRPDKASGFTTFLSICVRRQVLTAVKAAGRNKHSPLNGALSLRGSVIGGEDQEDPMLEDLIADDRRPQPDAVLEGKEEFAAVVGAFRRLTPVEREATTGIMVGASYADVAEEAGRSFKTIDNAHQRAKRKIREALEAAA
jgi:RNA polymerase sporulation-specific sigma factor